MNKIEKGRKQLIGISIGILVLSVLFVALGIVLIVLGAKNLAIEGNLGGKIVQLVFGVLVTLIGMAGTAFGVIFLCTGSAIKATNGNLAMDNSLAKGTANMAKCAYCGNELNGTEKFCGKCGHTLVAGKTCENCGAINDRDSKVCIMKTKFQR